MEIIIDKMGYTFYKGINALIFTNNYDETFEDVQEAFGEPNLLFLYLFDVIVLNLNKIIDDDMKRNITDVIEYFRVEYSKKHTEEKEKIFELCNEIISFVNENSFVGQDASIYCAEQLSIRGYSIMDRVKFTNGWNLMDTFNYLKQLNVQDFYMLNSHFLDKNREVFDLKKEEYSDPNFAYMQNISLIIAEYPDFLNDKVFVSRVNEIISLYEHKFETFVPSKNVKKKALKKQFDNFKRDMKKGIK